MYRLKAKAAFDSAHFLYGYEGKCLNIHGHRWVIEAELAGSDLQAEGVQRGMLIDFGDLKKALRSLAEHYDHSLIYEAGSLRDKTLEALQEEQFRLIEIACRPTAENFAALFFASLRQEGLPVAKVTVYETPDNCASYEEE